MAAENVFSFAPLKSFPYRSTRGLGYEQHGRLVKRVEWSKRITSWNVEQFAIDCRKTKTKAITPTNHNRSKQRNEPITIVAIIWNSLKAREESRVHGAIGFGLASHWLKNWRESFKPITKRCNRNHVITFDSHLKTALFPCIEVVTELMKDIGVTRDKASSDWSIRWPYSKNKPVCNCAQSTRA